MISETFISISLCKWVPGTASFMKSRRQRVDGGDLFLLLVFINCRATRSPSVHVGWKEPAAVTLLCPSTTVRGTLVEGHLFLGGKGLSLFHNTTICEGDAEGLRQCSSRRLSQSQFQHTAAILSSHVQIHVYYSFCTTRTSNEHMQNQTPTCTFMKNVQQQLCGRFPPLSVLFFLLIKV